MSQNYSNKINSIKIDPIPIKPLASGASKWRRAWMALVLPAWVVASFYLAQAILIGIVWLLDYFNVPLDLINQSILSTAMSALVYIITLVLIWLTPVFIKKYHVASLDNIGMNRLPSWVDILITPAGLIIYLVMSSLLMLAATHFLTWIDINQVQETGFNNLSKYYEYILAFSTLVIIAPVAEEVLFRGYLFGKLKNYIPTWVAILITSALFGAIHGQWDLAIDTFALSVVLCLLREATGSLWASILLHMTKNGIAFYILFINPLILTTIVK